jgi:hypothetical protein
MPDASRSVLGRSLYRPRRPSTERDASGIHRESTSCILSTPQSPRRSPPVERCCTTVEKSNDRRLSSPRVGSRPTRQPLASVEFQAKGRTKSHKKVRRRWRCMPLATSLLAFGSPRARSVERCCTTVEKSNDRRLSSPRVGSRPTRQPLASTKHRA